MNGTLLYVGSLRPGGNGRDRCALFEAAGFSVREADRFSHMMAGTRPERSMAARFHVGRSVIAFNQMLEAQAKAGGYDAVFVDKGVWVWHDTLKQLKEAAGWGIALHYTPDAQFLENRSRHFFRALPDYDLAITTKPFEVAEYQKAGARKTLLIHQGFGKRLAPVPEAEVPEHLRSEVVFIGHCQPAYAKLLEKVAARVPLTIWGPGWTAYAKRNDWAKPVVQGEGVYGPDYARALSGAKIAIGLLSRRIPETTTTRSFEIPACGTLLLAERTADHETLFADGCEAVFFDSAEDCTSKAAYYLAHAIEREAIASAGMNRCRANYEIEDQFRQVIAWLKEESAK